jgi:hypothetical protein
MGVRRRTTPVNAWRQTMVITFAGIDGMREAYRR